MKKLIPILLCVLVIAGCTSKTPIDQAASYGISTDPDKATVAACYQYLADVERAEQDVYNGMASTDKAFALGMREMRKMAESMSGSRKDQCKPGTNVWDATIAYNNADAATKQMLIKEGAATLRFASGVAGTAYAIDAVAGKIGDKINNSGDGAQVSTSKEDNDNVAVANDKSQASSSRDSAVEKSKTATTGEAISATALADCRTTSAGAATADELHACLSKDHGYATTIQDGVVYYNGAPL